MLQDLEVPLASQEPLDLLVLWEPRVYQATLEVPQAPPVPQVQVPQVPQELWDFLEPQEPQDHKERPAEPQVLQVPLVSQEPLEFPEHLLE